MNKKEFEKTDKPMSFCLSYDPITKKTMFSYFEGNSEDMLKKFKKDFPRMFHFHRENFASRKKWVKERFNYDIKGGFASVSKNEVKDGK
jgi:hypothetical protein